MLPTWTRPPVPAALVPVVEVVVPVAVISAVADGVPVPAAPVAVPVMALVPVISLVADGVSVPVALVDEPLVVLVAVPVVLLTVSVGRGVAVPLGGIALVAVGVPVPDVVPAAPVPVAPVPVVDVLPATGVVVPVADPVVPVPVVPVPVVPVTVVELPMPSWLQNAFNSLLRSSSRVFGAA